MLILRSIFILTFYLLGTQLSYGFVSIFGDDDVQNRKTITATAEVWDNVAKYKSEAEIYFKEKNIDAVLEKYQKLYA